VHNSILGKSVRHLSLGPLDYIDRYDLNAADYADNLAIYREANENEDLLQLLDKGVRWRSEDAMLATLVTGLPNLTSLTIRLDKVPWMLCNIINRVAGGMLPSLRSLTKVTIEQDGPWNGAKTDLLARFALLPSVETIHVVDIIMGWPGSDPIYQPIHLSPGSSSIKSLMFQGRLPTADRLEMLIHACRGLESFHCREMHSMPDCFGKCDEVLRLLPLAKATLVSLSMDYSLIGTDSANLDLAGFPVLKHLQCPSSLILKRSPHRLVEKLPASLETLRLGERLGALSEDGFASVIEELIENKYACVPHLRQLVLGIDLSSISQASRASREEAYRQQFRHVIHMAIDQGTQLDIIVADRRDFYRREFGEDI
jgi:hypothetical protein